jgi:O-antigen/teichoic acid export membrane protein
MKPLSAGRQTLLRNLSGGVAVQAMLSASNFAVGLMLVRRASVGQYGFYVLITTAVLLVTIMQGAFIQPPMVIRLTRFDTEQRANLVGGLLRDQRRLMPFIAIPTVLIAGFLEVRGLLTGAVAAILVCSVIAILATLRREFFRMVLFAYHRPNDVLSGDCVYCATMLIGAYLATLTPFPAATAALTLAFANLIGGSLLSRAMWHHEPWNPAAPRGMIRELAPQGGWSAFGGCVHWLFSQGYNYLVAGMLDVSAVAALAAARLLVMPVGLLSTGIGTLLFPTVARWNQNLRANQVLRRLMLFAFAIALAAAGYLLVLWLMRDWVSDHLLKKHFANRDALLAFWAVIALVTVLRDQSLYFLAARARFRLLSTVTLVSAVFSFTVSYFAMQRLGALGALYGLLAGEILNFAGITFFSALEAKRSPVP